MTPFERIVMEGRVIRVTDWAVEITVGDDRYQLRHSYWVERDHRGNRITAHRKIEAHKLNKRDLGLSPVLQPDIIRKALLLVAWPHMSDDDDLG